MSAALSRRDLEGLPASFRDRLAHDGAEDKSVLSTWNMGRSRSQQLALKWPDVRICVPVSGTVPVAHGFYAHLVDGECHLVTHAFPFCAHFTCPAKLAVTTIGFKKGRSNGYECLDRRRRRKLLVGVGHRRIGRRLQMDGALILRVRHP